jgi:hypothetical protein
VGLRSRVAVAGRATASITCVSGWADWAEKSDNGHRKLYANHGTGRLVDLVAAPDTPFFHAYFKPPRIRSSRGLTSFPVVVGLVSAIVNGGLYTTNLATRGDPTLYHGCHLF